MARQAERHLDNARTPRLLGAIGISTVGHVYDRHYAFFVINPVDHAISTAAGTEPVVHWREQPLADPVRIGKQRSREELISSRRNGFRKRAAQCAADGRSCPQLIGLFFELTA